MNPGTNQAIVAAAAQKIANRRMRAEILPQLSTTTRVNSWNPLRTDTSDMSDYGMKLWTSDKLVQQLMTNWDLMQATKQIVIESVQEAAVQEGQAFVSDIFFELTESIPKQFKRVKTAS